MAGQEAGHQLWEVPVSPSTAVRPASSYESETSRDRCVLGLLARGSLLGVIGSGFIALGSGLLAGGYWLGAVGCSSRRRLQGASAKKPRRSPGYTQDL